MILPCRVLHERHDVTRRVDHTARDHRNPGLLCQVARGRLVPEQLKGAGRGSDERQTRRLTGAGEVRVFTEKSISRVHIGAPVVTAASTTWSMSR